MIHLAGKISSRRSATSGVGLGSGKRREVRMRDVLTTMVINNITQIMKEKVTTIMGVRLGTKNVVTGRSNSIPTCIFSL